MRSARHEHHLPLLAWFGVALFAALGVGCSGDKVPPGKPCLINSDCTGALVCTFGRCHTACAAAKDCDLGQECVATAAGNVCILADEASCAATGVCPVGLVCAADQRCHASCTASGSCATPSQVCATPAMVCLEPSSGGTGGAGATGGSAGPMGGAGGAGTGGAGGASGGAGGSPGVACGTTETTPNDAQGQATALTLAAATTACIETASDHDFYRLTIPVDRTGGFLRVAITNVTGNGAIAMHFPAGNGGASSDGAALFMYEAVAPGSEVVLDVERFTAYNFKGPFAYTLTATYTPILDSYEPNDVRQDAKTIAVGTPVSGFLVAPYTGTKRGPWSDFYKVTLAAGPATISLMNVPTNVPPELVLYTPTGTMLKDELSFTKGADLIISADIPAAGDYFVAASALATGVLPDDVGQGDTLPDNFTRAYVLKVSQP